jgi:hypothetical protein
MTPIAAVAVAWAVPEAELASVHPAAIDALYRAAVHRGLLVPEITRETA